MERIAVFCGAQLGTDERFAALTVATAQRIVARGYGVVYGGGRVGLMGVLADAALAAGGEVIGVIPHALAGSEIAHGGLSQLHVVESMHARKALMADLSCAFVALPGGFGTMEEFHEVLTWTQLHVHDKPVGLLNHLGFYDELLALYDTMLRTGFMSPETRALAHAAADIDTLLDELLP